MLTKSVLTNNEVQLCQQIIFHNWLITYLLVFVTHSQNTTFKKNFKEDITYRCGQTVVVFYEVFFPVLFI